MSPEFPIAKVVVNLPVEGPFDYFIPQHLRACVAVGQRVRVLFNRRMHVGFIVGFAAKSPFKKLNPLLTLLDKAPSLDTRSLQLTRNISEYYGCSWGAAVAAYLPDALRKPALTDIPPDDKPAAVSGAEGDIILLNDVSGREHWPFLMEKIKQTLKDNQTVIVLVPEIFYIDDVKMKFQKELNCEIGVIDKRLSAKGELETWLKINRGAVPVVIGTRSAVFSPAVRLGLIIVLEEENGVYRQEQAPHYHARQVALMRNSLEKCQVILQSAVPTAETWWLAKKKKWTIASFSTPFSSHVQLIDMANYNPQKTSIISFPLQNHLQQCLENKKKAVLFMNRRGFTTMTRCRQCGFTLKCPRCDINLAFIYSTKKMTCRRCAYETTLPTVCPQCKGAYLKSTGIGIERLESEVIRYFPYAKICHFDQDSGGFPHEADVIIATQAIVKYKERVKVGLVGVLDFDAELNHFDFRSAQKAFSTLVYLRAMATDKLLVQTRMIDNYCLQAIKTINLKYFYRQELKIRRQLNYPPFRHLITISLRGRNEKDVIEQTKSIFEKLNAVSKAAVEISDPHPASTAKLRDKYHYAINLKGKSVQPLLLLIQRSLKDIKQKRNVVVTINVDA